MTQNGEHAHYRACIHKRAVHDCQDREIAVPLCHTSSTAAASIEPRCHPALRAPPARCCPARRAAASRRTAEPTAFGNPSVFRRGEDIVLRRAIR
eukprot:7377628-Prymnesium_polylepis.1